LKKIILKKGKEKSFINRHPWVFSGAVQSSENLENGGIAALYTADNQILGHGFFTNKSQIVCRVFDYDLKYDGSENYWSKKMENIFHFKQSLINKEETNCYRLIHSEGDFLPGLVADVYDEVLVLQIGTKGIEKMLPLFTKIFQNLDFKYIYVKNKNQSKNTDHIEINGWITEKGPEKIVVKEHGFLFEIDIIHGQKTGFFIDQRENRNILKQFCEDKKVLNTFAYSGGFSVYAMAGKASLVHSVDISADAISICDKNITLNNFKGEHQSFATDCFEFLNNLPTQYDVIVLDPPAFAKNSAAVNKAARGYKEINMKAIKNIAPNGLIFTFSCSQHIDTNLFQKIVFSAAADAKRNVRILKHLSQAECHPQNIFHPESEYLKGLIIHVE